MLTARNLREEAEQVAREEIDAEEVVRDEHERRLKHVPKSQSGTYAAGSPSDVLVLRGTPSVAAPPVPGLSAAESEASRAARPVVPSLPSVPETEASRPVIPPLPTVPEARSFSGAEHSSVYRL